MNREIITIENGIISIPQSGEVWMSQWEIAQLFDCFIAKISANVRSILKSEVLRESDVCRMYHYKNGNSVEQYNLEMITALFVPHSVEECGGIPEVLVKKVD